MNVTRFLFPALLLALAAAASADTKYDPQRDGKVVIGFAPDTLMVWIGEGKLSRKRWKSTQVRATFSGTAKDGFIVTRVRANTLMAIRAIRPADGSRSQYWICATAFTPTFTVPPGKVLYLGDLAYKWPDDLEPWVNMGDPDFERARRFVDANYPELRGKLEPGTYSMMRTWTNCSTKNGSLGYAR